MTRISQHKSIQNGNHPKKLVVHDCPYSSFLRTTCMVSFGQFFSCKCDLMYGRFMTINTKQDIKKCNNKSLPKGIFFGDRTFIQCQICLVAVLRFPFLIAYRLETSVGLSYIKRVGQIVFIQQSDGYDNLDIIEIHSYK